MPEKKTPTAEGVIAAARRDRQQREAGYRERALKLFRTSAPAAVGS